MRPVTTTNEQIEQIKSLHLQGFSQRQIANKVRLSQYTVFNILNPSFKEKKKKYETFEFANRCVITGFRFPDMRDNRLK